MTDLHMRERQGFTGKLNDALLERVHFVSRRLNLPQIESKFPHLSVSDGSWRKSPPGDDVNLATFIDHTLLKPEATQALIMKLCKEARDHRFHAVCVNGSRVRCCVKALKGSGVRVAACCGFPLGAGSTEAKVAEAVAAVRDGAADIDMVINVGAVKERNYCLVYSDIKAVVDACGHNVTTKVIFETCLLTPEEIIDCCILSVAAGASFVKTSTGFNIGGATPEAVDMMLATVGNEAKVKVSGGVRDRETALQYVKVGVSRIGTSSGIAIITHTDRSRSKY
ncbi:deoxyribose-phosphate aldolase, putative [Trypanosoma brucei brucei TREU927]|uniref:deoxyribose-phosphate aldolase n=1 Tax=Trypanosoma brucei brucei (strain 927/4 GUTat10.1) TaxID=185431 RepID=Q582I3_TRYB2|nr:deoxyribose-phosphate aldolase, putative [Trypanosoma brucei brucei TREU927]AAX78848.1 deoxyribose-phosphate aldolase, putative [Trypanosoma brucei]AAZ12632.1 deoxyribose-phosphate aldolase, putative [Trypanosoma brucei brucei TREU927]